MPRVITISPLLFVPQFFHFSSLVFPPRDGQFNGRVKWLGSPARGEASIQLLNASLSDNGTYTCSVRNPPDVHGSPTSQTVLTVTSKGEAITSKNLCLGQCIDVNGTFEHIFQ